MTVYLIYFSISWAIFHRIEGRHGKTISSFLQLCLFESDDSCIQTQARKRIKLAHWVSVSPRHKCTVYSIQHSSLHKLIFAQELSCRSNRVNLLTVNLITASLNRGRSVTWVSCKRVCPVKKRPMMIRGHPKKVFKMRFRIF